MSNLGYTDTPIIPGSEYCVHDARRPQPPVVTPGTASTPDRPGRPPADAQVLFEGSNLDGWTNREGAPAGWKCEAGYMEVVPKTGDIQSRAALGSGQLHLEFACPSEVLGESQGRGNSGVFLMGLYEIQVLDGYRNPTYADGTTGAIYGQTPPRVNACRAPGEWQSYDIVWEAPAFEGDRLVQPAFVTVFLNGLLLHHRVELLGPTKHRTNTAYVAHPPAAPLQLQDHGDRVRFRNIWFRPLVF